MNLMVLPLMVFLHVVDDYYLQGCLAKFKQKSYWEENAPDKIYRYDYIMALAMHAFSWTFMIQLPVMVMIFIGLRSNIKDYCVLFIMNWITHAMVDHLKANRKCINLIQDQLIHLVQIIYTWVCLVIY